MNRKSVTKVQAAIVGVVVIVAAVVGTAWWLSMQPTAPKVPQVLKAAMEVDITGLDPHFHGGFDMRVWCNMYEGLLTMDVTGKPVPALATNWEWVDNTHLRCYLRKGVKFHCGSPFNASAAAVAWFREANPKDPGIHYGTSWRNFKPDVTIVDDYTIIVETQKPFVPAFIRLCMPEMSLVCPTCLKKYGDLETHACGTGPWKLDHWELHKYVRLVPNKEYWGGTPKLEALEIHIIPEEGARIMALMKGEIHWVPAVGPEYLKMVKDNPRIETLHQPAERNVCFEFNWRYLNTKFGKDNASLLRKAIMYALDTKTITETLLPGVGTPATSCMPPIIWGYIPVPDYPNYDREKAKALLAKGGWVDRNGDGWVEWWDGTQLKLHLITSPRDLKNKEVAEIGAEYLKKMGIQVKITLYEWATMQQIALGADDTAYDMIVAGRGWGAMDADTFNGWLHSKVAAPKPGWGWDRVEDPELDALLDAHQVEFDANKRLKIIAELQKFIIDRAYVVPNHDIVRVRANWNYVKGLKPFPAEWYPYFFNDAWIDETLWREAHAR